MTPRTLLIVGAVVVGIALLGQYIGVHTLTSPPALNETPAAYERKTERYTQPTNRRPPSGREARQIEQQRDDSTTRPARDLSSIEDLLAPESEQ